MLLALAGGMPRAAFASEAAQKLLGRQGVSLAPLARVRRTADGYAFDPPPEVGPALFQTMRASGVEIVRLVVRPMPLLAGRPAAQARAQDQVIAMTRALNAAGLTTIVDLHPWPPDTVAQEAALICTSKGVAALERVLVSLAAALRLEAPGRVALELLNEPKPCDVNGQIRWPSLQRQLVRRIRAIAPALPIVVTGPSGQTNDLLGLDVGSYVSDPNIYFSFHFYDPFIFTTPGYFNAKNVPFPSPGRMTAGLRTSLSRAETPMSPQQKRDLQRYYVGPYGADEMAGRFAEVARWRTDRGLSPNRVILGEYGVVRDAAAGAVEGRQDELRWVRLVTRLADQNGFRRLLWTWPIREHHDYDGRTGMIRRDVAAAAGFKLHSPALDANATAEHTK